MCKASTSNVSVPSVASLEQAMEEQLEDKEFSEDAIQFVQSKPRAMRWWATLAHRVGMTNRVEVIRHRVRSNGGDFDEHVGEFLREWKEEKPLEATLSGLCNLLRSQGINDTGNQLGKQFGRENTPPASPGIPVDESTEETEDEVEQEIGIEESQAEGIPEVDKVNVEHTVNCAEDE